MHSRTTAPSAATANIENTGSATLNATIGVNTFTNNNAGGTNFDMTTNAAGAAIRLNLTGNTATGGTGRLQPDEQRRHVHRL